MTERKPRILYASLAKDGHVDVHIVYEGMKSRPIDVVRMEPRQAVGLAEELLRAARRAL